ACRCAGARCRAGSDRDVHARSRRGRRSSALVPCRGGGVARLGARDRRSGRGDGGADATHAAAVDPRDQRTSGDRNRFRPRCSWRHGGRDVMHAVGRAARGVGAVAVLVGLLVGMPAFLAGALGWPLPRAVPAWDQITGTFSGALPLEATTVWKVLACFVWVAWAQILSAAAVEAVALARGGVAAPFRGLAHVQGLAGSLLGTALLLLPGTLARPAPVHDAPSITAARALVAHTAIPAAPPHDVNHQDDRSRAEAPTMEHTVVRRDTLWDLAERYIAPGGSVEEVSAAVRQLFELNQGRPQPDGSALTDASLLRPGWVLRIPLRHAPPP